MKKLNTFAAVAVALGISLAPQANAEITLEPNGAGDALLFPIFNGYVENYFTVSNHSPLFVQGHLRFRGAAWSGELRDFDVILTPGDVLVFRVADLDGDGYWEIDQSLDARTSTEKARMDKPKTFENTGMVFYQCNNSSSPCLKPSEVLLPSFCYTEITDKSTDIEKYRKATCEHHRHVGYVEFIGEAVLDNMTHEIMQVLVDNPSSAEWKSYVTENGNKSGTSAWKWSAAVDKFPDCAVANGVVTNNPCNRGLSDVGDWLSGTAFITIPGQTHGLAYNAEAFNNFRTANFEHRIDNYVYDGENTEYDTKGLVISRTPKITAGLPTAVILHHENGDTTHAERDYVYGCPHKDEGGTELYDDELVISFNNTWGPTMADGDDTETAGGAGFDPWDVNRFGYRDLSPINVATTNSISEVETAIEKAGQVFYSYYFDNMPFDGSKVGGKATLKSQYVALFPTKFYYGENISTYSTLVKKDTSKTKADTCKNYRESMILHLLNVRNPLSAQVWNTNEQTSPNAPTVVSISPDISYTPTCTVDGSSGGSSNSCHILGLELNNWDIDWLKAGLGLSGSTGFESGRVVVQIENSDVGFYPGLLYTFDFGSDSSISHWRAMQR